MEDATQAGDVIDKIIEYEKTPPATPAHTDYYTDTSLVCLFEDARPRDDADAASGNGQEDRTFRIIEFAEAIRAFLSGSRASDSRCHPYNDAPDGPPSVLTHQATSQPSVRHIAPSYRRWALLPCDVRSTGNQHNQRE